MGSLKSCWRQSDLRNHFSYSRSLSIAFQSIHLKCTEISYQAHKVHPRQIRKLWINSGFLFWNFVHWIYISFKGDFEGCIGRQVSATKRKLVSLQYIFIHSYLRCAALHCLASNIRWLWESFCVKTPNLDSSKVYWISVSHLSIRAENRQKVTSIGIMLAWKFHHPLMTVVCYVIEYRTLKYVKVLRSCILQALLEELLSWRFLWRNKWTWLHFNSLDERYRNAFLLVFEWIRGISNQWEAFWGIFFKTSGQQTRRPKKNQLQNNLLVTQSRKSR